MTCEARVGLGLPDELAEGAATGRPHARSSAAATGCEGILTATVERPAVTSSGMSGYLLNNIVKGPGQKASIRGIASSGTAHRRSI